MRLTKKQREEVEHHLHALETAWPDAPDGAWFSLVQEACEAATQDLQSPCNGLDADDVCDAYIDALGEEGTP